MVWLSSSVCGSGRVAEAGHIIVGQEAEEGGRQDWDRGVIFQVTPSLLPPTSTT